MTSAPPNLPGPPSGKPSDELRERTRQQILDSMGGWSGTVVATIPLVVFVIVNAVSGLRAAIWAAVGAGVLTAGYRMARRQPVQQAIGGLFSVAIAAAIAARTGQARGYFLFGIASAFGYAAVFAGSLLVRRPLVGVLWEYLDPSPLPPEQRWHQVRRLRRAYDIATAAVLAMFLARALVQLSLFKDNRTGLLAAAKIAMGLPLYLAVVAVVFWVVRRARHQLGLGSALTGPAAIGPVAVADPPEFERPEFEQPEFERSEFEQPTPGQLRSGGADGSPDGGLGLRKGDE